MEFQCNTGHVQGISTNQHTLLKITPNDTNQIQIYCPKACNNGHLLSLKIDKLYTVRNMEISQYKYDIKTH